MTFRPVRDVTRLVARYRGTLPDRVTHRMIEIGGYDRALALAAQAFVALFPMLLGLSALVPADRRAELVATGLGISPEAAAQLATLVGDGPVQAQPLTIVGMVVLVVSVLGFARSLQRTYLAAWDLPSAGVRGYGHGLFAAAAIVAEFILIAFLGPVLVRLSDSLPFGVAVHAAVAGLAWWPVQRVLLGGRVGWRALAPGAAVTGVGQAGVALASSLLVPALFSREAARYGLAGLGVALVSWMVVLGVLLVVAAVLGAELGRPHTDGALRSSGA